MGAGVPSPVKNPGAVDMVIFRENCEDIYAGIEFQQGTPDAEKFAKLLKDNFPDRFKKARPAASSAARASACTYLPARDKRLLRVPQVRFPGSAGYGVKAVSREGTERLMDAAIKFALDSKRKSVTLVHKGEESGSPASARVAPPHVLTRCMPASGATCAGNIMKNTEGAFRDWGYKLAQNKYRNAVVTERESWILANKDKDASMSVEANAKNIEPGYDMMTPAQQQKLRDEVEGVLSQVRARRSSRAVRCQTC